MIDKGVSLTSLLASFSIRFIRFFSFAFASLSLENSSNCFFFSDFFKMSTTCGLDVSLVFFFFTVFTSEFFISSLTLIFASLV